MTNAEKFEEVFGIELDLITMDEMNISICDMICHDFCANFSCNRCPVEDFWRQEYAEWD